MTDTSSIIDEINARLSAVEQTHGYLGTLKEQGEERIGKFLNWAIAQPHNKTIELRPRTCKLYGDGSKKKSNFNATNLYEELFHNIKKTRTENNDGFEVSCPLKFDITLNKDLANKGLKQGANELEECNNEDDELFYGVVTLGNVPVLYLLYIDPSTDLDFID